MCGCLDFVKKRLLDDKESKYNYHNRYNGDCNCDPICRNKQAKNELSTKRTTDKKMNVRVSLTMSPVADCVVLFTAEWLNVDRDILLFHRVCSCTFICRVVILLVYSERQRDSMAALIHYLLMSVPQQSRLFFWVHETQQGAAVSTHAQSVHCRCRDGRWRRNQWQITNEAEKLS